MNKTYQKTENTSCPETFILPDQSTKMPGNCGGGRLTGETSDENVWNFICRAHDSTWCDMAERRFYVMNFFRQAKDFFPGLKDKLELLDKHFYYANEIMGNRENGYASEAGDPVDLRIFRKPDVRARMADCVRRFREADAKGLEMVEELMSYLNDKKKCHS